MNDLTPKAATETALAIPTGTNLTAMFSQPEQVDELIGRIEAEVRSHAPDVTTAKGRKAIASLAHTVARSKTALDGAGKSLTDDARKQIAAVDAERRKIRERLDALKSEARKPLDDWEAAEEARVDAHKRELNVFDLGRVDANSTADQVRHVLDDIQNATTGPEWDEFQPIAEARKEQAVGHFTALLSAAEKREADAAELARLRAEAEDRARKEEEQRLAAEKAEADRIAAEQAEARRIEAEKAEAARREQAERDKAEAAHRARKEAAEQAERAAKEAEERHAREMAEAKAREEAAAQRERDRLAAERKAEADARAKREADQAHRARIKGDITDALSGMRGHATPEAIADALMAGKIPHTKVTL